MLISVTQYAKQHGKDVGRVRRMIMAGRLPAQKIGNQWAIDADEPYPADARITTGAYRNWRKPKEPKEPQE